MELFSRKKSYSERNESSQVIDNLENRLNSKILQELKIKVDNLNLKMSELEKRINSFFPENNEKKNLFLEQSDQFYTEIGKLYNKLSELEKKFNERVPEVILSESRFREESQDSEELVKKIVFELKNILKKPQPPEENLTIVESKRIENIRSLLKKHEKLSSTELSQLMGLSRTRCNEYFKKMENLGIVKPILVRREKYYRLKS